MKKAQNFKERRQEERREYNKKLERTIRRNWIICIASAVIIIIAMFFSK